MRDYRYRDSAQVELIGGSADNLRSVRSAGHRSSRMVRAGSLIHRVDQPSKSVAEVRSSRRPSVMQKPDQHPEVGLTVSFLLDDLCRCRLRTGSLLYAPSKPSTPRLGVQLGFLRACCHSRTMTGEVGGVGGYTRRPLHIIT